jgi:hypothetical protein
VRKLISGPRVNICDECVALCDDILAETWADDLRTQTAGISAVEDPIESATFAGPIGSEFPGPLEVRHTPLLRKAVPREFIDRLRLGHYPYVRLYRTEVRNNADRPMRIVWFDGLLWFNGQWTASNVGNRVLRTSDFIDWYSSEEMTPDGWLHPGGTASDPVNWHCTETPEEVPSKWAYLAVDAQGRDYFVEAMVPAIRALRISA